MKKADKVATDKLANYGSRLMDYGSCLGHFTNTLIPQLWSSLDAFATCVATIKGRPPNPTTHNVRHSDASSTASVADDTSDRIRPPNVENERFSTTKSSPNIEDERLTPTAHSCMAWAEAHNTRATDDHPVEDTYDQPPSYHDNRSNPICRPDLPVDKFDTPYEWLPWSSGRLSTLQNKGLGFKTSAWRT